MILKIITRSLFILGLLSFQNVFSQLTPQEISIPMRDGKVLSAHLYLPNATETFPTILIQTPYNKDNYKTFGLPLGVREEISSSNYAFVIVDWRCFYASGGACIASPNRGNDGYDIVEWIASQTWSDGKIGTWGPSALGNIQFDTAIKKPPHLVCAVPEVSAPGTYYDNFYPGGVLRSGYIKSLNVLYGGVFNTVINNPYYNNTWQFVENGNPNIADVDVPMLLVAGWYDHNTNRDIAILEELRTTTGLNVRDKHKILIGPWVHGGTSQAFVGSLNQGELNYPSAALKNHTYENAFFDFYLRGINNGWESDSSIITYYQLNEQKWAHATTWPPITTSIKTLFFTADNRLLDTIPNESFLSYTYDPEDPSPSVGGKTLTPGLDQGPLDQRALVESRADALVFTSDAFVADLVVKGTISAKLFVSSDKLDTDFMARLTEVYPDGRSMLLGETALRMRYRNGNTVADTSFMKKGEVYEISVDFDELAVTFPAGHKVRVVITSSNYPHYNRNMNTGEAMYPNTNPDTLVAPELAINSLWFGTNYPSQLTMAVVSCDSTLVHISDTICEGSTYILPNNSNVSSAGEYTNVFQNAAGCDSTITTTLTVLDTATISFTIDSISQYTYRLDAGVDTSKFLVEWYSISGVRLGEGIFTYTESDTTQMGIILICKVSNLCFTTTKKLTLTYGTVGITTHVAESFIPLHIFPNPSRGTLHLQNPPDQFSAVIIDISGREVLVIKNTSETNIDARSLTPGKYFVILRSTKGVFRAEILIQ